MSVGGKPDGNARDSRSSVRGWKCRRRVLGRVWNMQGGPRLNSHPITGLDAMAAEELGGGDGLLPRDLEKPDLDGGFARRDDQAVTRSLDDLAGATLAVNDRRLVDDQANRVLAVRVARVPGRERDRPRLEGADLIMDGLGGPRPVDLAVLLPQLRRLGDLRSVLGQDRDRSGCQGGDGSGHQRST